MDKRGLLIIVLALLALGGGLLAAACGGDSAEPEPTIATITPESTAAPTATQEAAPTDPPAPTATPRPPAPTGTPQPPAPTATPQPSLSPRISCPKRTHYHLNIESLRVQPGLTDAAITELDANTIRVEFQGEVYEISGGGDNITIGGSGDATGEFFDSLMSAILAVASEC